MLNNAARSLSNGMRLRVSAALRTIDDQRHHWDGYYAQLREAHPDWPEATLHRAVNRFFAPTDQAAPPGHCTGGAVDVRLVDADGVLLDMISPFEGWHAAPTWKTGLSETARSNRETMVYAMIMAGFSNCCQEYWHYSYGDSAWAVRIGARECPYGLVRPPLIRAEEARGSNAS